MRLQCYKVSSESIRVHACQCGRSNMIAKVFYGTRHEYIACRSEARRRDSYPPESPFRDRSCRSQIDFVIWPDRIEVAEKFLILLY